MSTDLHKEGVKIRLIKRTAYLTSVINTGTNKSHNQIHRDV